jgi:pilus retraction protein PilT
MKQFSDLVNTAVKEGFSDLHITGNQPLVYRRNGVISIDKAVRWGYREIDDLVRGLLSPFQLEILRSRWSVDFAFSLQHIRIRMNVFSTVQGLSLAIRLLPGAVPTTAMLNLHPSLQQIGELRTGLVLICGTTGCGKTTTIASIVEEINRSRSAHIVTLEDPIEFRFVSKKSFIQQREVGTHVPSFRQGLLDVLREDPDVIVVGELREPETIRLTLNAAEAGHLVIASIHAAQAEDAIYRICNAFQIDSQEEIRFQLASALSWVVIQQLFYLERFKFRVPLLAILRGTQSVKGTIRENRLPQIENIMHTGKKDGMFTMERYLSEFINTRETFTHPVHSFRPATEAVQEPSYFSPLLGTGLPRALPLTAPSPKGPQARPAPPPASDPAAPVPVPEEAQYIISGDERLEDLIAELGKEDRYSPEEP